MRIQLQLSSKLIEYLSAEAKARGIGWENYAETLLREAIATHAAPAGQLSVEELHSMLRAIAEDSKKLPRDRTSAFARESFYE